MREMDFHIYQCAREQGVSWMVGINRIAYLRPAMLMEQVWIDSTIIAWREREIVVEMRMWDHKKSTLKALLWSTFVHVDMRTGRSLPHSPELTARLQPFEAPLPDAAMGFEERVEELRNKVKDRKS